MTTTTTSHNPTHADERRAAIAIAWSTYRAQAARLSSNRRLGWTDYLEADQRAWQRYLAAEREAATLPTIALRATVERG